MSQKVIANFVSNAEDIAANINLTIQENNPKNLGQAVHNVLLGMELISVVENAYEEIASILLQVKYWVSSSLKSNSKKRTNIRFGNQNLPEVKGFRSSSRNL